MLGRELAAAGLVVVSGLARGVDGAAHQCALEAGVTIVAVLGCGIDRDYPAAHAGLAREICERGLVVSEYAPGVEPAPWRFPPGNAEVFEPSRFGFTKPFVSVVPGAKCCAGVVPVWSRGNKEKGSVLAAQHTPVSGLRDVFRARGKGETTG